MTLFVSKLSPQLCCSHLPLLALPYHPCIDDQRITPALGRAEALSAPIPRSTPPTRRDFRRRSWCRGITLLSGVIGSPIRLLSRADQRHRRGLGFNPQRSPTLLRGGAALLGGRALIARAVVGAERGRVRLVDGWTGGKWRWRDSDDPRPLARLTRVLAGEGVCCSQGDGVDACSSTS